MLPGVMDLLAMGAKKQCKPPRNLFWWWILVLWCMGSGIEAGNISESFFHVLGGSKALSERKENEQEWHCPINVTELKRCGCETIRRTECEYTHLSCKNGGYVRDGDCLKHAYCEVQDQPGVFAYGQSGYFAPFAPPGMVVDCERYFDDDDRAAQRYAWYGCTSKDSKAHWVDYAETCQCPDGWVGPECEIPVNWQYNESTCDTKSQIWDASVVNMARGTNDPPLHYFCNLSFPYEKVLTVDLKLRSAKIQGSFNPQNKSAKFRITSRALYDTERYGPEVPSDVDPRWECGPASINADCLAWECEFLVNTTVSRDLNGSYCPVNSTNNSTAGMYIKSNPGDAIVKCAKSYCTTKKGFKQQNTMIFDALVDDFNDGMSFTIVNTSLKDGRWNLMWTAPVFSKNGWPAMNLTCSSGTCSPRPKWLTQKALYLNETIGCNRGVSPSPSPGPPDKTRAEVWTLKAIFISVPAFLYALTLAVAFSVSERQRRRREERLANQEEHPYIPSHNNSDAARTHEPIGERARLDEPLLTSNSRTEPEGIDLEQNSTSQEREGMTSRVPPTLQRIDSTSTANRENFEICHPRFGLAFVDVEYTVKLPGLSWQQRERKVLKSITGIVEPGELVAIMGSSGSGKSSLLDILAGRNKVGVVGGKVTLLNPQSFGYGANTGSPRPREISMSSASLAPNFRYDQVASSLMVNYVLQDDRLLETETVAEAIAFSAMMRIGRGYYEDPRVRRELDTRTEKVMGALAISHIADSKIGSTNSGGLSGGERRRTAIACELVVDPSLLLLDEPTSGLDSFSAEVVMKVLRQVASKENDGCACIFSIHQPPAKVFRMFDKVMLMSRTGGQAYFGSPQAAIEHMKRINRWTDDEWSHPAELLVDICSVGEPEELDNLCALFARSEQAQQLRSMASIAQRERPAVHNDPYSMEQVAQAIVETGSAMIFSGSCSMNERTGSYGNVPTNFQRFILLCERATRTALRDKTLMVLQLGLTVVVAACIAAFVRRLPRDLHGSTTRVSLFNFMILYFSMMSMSGIGTFVAELNVFTREKAAGYYTTLPYFLSKVVCDMLPLRVLPPVALGYIVYWLVLLCPQYTIHGASPTPISQCSVAHDIGNFFIFLSILVLANLASISACFAISAAAKNSFSRANLVASFFIMYSFIFSGLMLSSSTAANRIRYTSFFFYAWEAMCINHFSTGEFLFNPDDAEFKDLALWRPAVDILNQFFLRDDRLVLDILVLAGMAIFFLLATLLIMTYTTFKR